MNGFKAFGRRSGRFLRKPQSVDIGAAVGPLGHYIEGDLLGERAEFVFTDGDDPLGAEYLLYLPDGGHISRCYRSS
jgi:hypothetical protein